MKKLYLILAVIILVGLPAGVCFYVNSHGTGTVHARDLGIRPNGGDLVSARAKFADMGAGKSARLNSQELTAWLGHGEKQATPFRETQVKVNPDNSVEISTLLISKELVPYASAHGMSAQAAQQLVDQLGGSEAVPLYIHCCPSVTKGHLDLTIREVQVQDVSVPRFILKDKQDEIRQMLQNEAQRSKIDNLSVDNGAIVLQFVKNPD